MVAIKLVNRRLRFHGKVLQVGRLRDIRAGMLFALIATVASCGTMGGYSVSDDDRATKQVWANNGYSRAILRPPSSEVNYSIAEFAEALADVSADTTTFVFVLRSATMRVAFSDEHEIDGWLEMRRGSNGRTYIYWTAIEARAPAITDELPVSEAREISKRAITHFNDIAPRAHDSLVNDVD